MEKWVEFIGMPVYSKKNSKQITKQKRIISSKQVRNYEKTMGPVFQEKLKEWRKQYEKHPERPIHVEFYFLRPSKAKWDFCNLIQLPLDMMQEYLYIPDDCTREIIPHYAGEEVVKKESSGFKMRIINE